jgi:PhoH-like ATPase
MLYDKHRGLFLPHITQELSKQKFIPGTQTPPDKKLYVLDTNVLIHNPAAIYNFEEHDIFLSWTVLKELDANKKGLGEVPGNVRLVSRWILGIVGDARGDTLAHGIPIKLPDGNGVGNVCPLGKLRFQTDDWPKLSPVAIGCDNDFRIISIVRDLQLQHPELEVVLVSKDINCRIRAATYNITTEDYENDKVIDDVADLYTGMFELPDYSECSEYTFEYSEPDKQADVYCIVSGAPVAQWYPYQCIYQDDLEMIVVKKIEPTIAQCRLARDYRNKNNVWGITARNREQNFAFNLLADPDADLVTFEASAGTGKTLLTIAMALCLVMEKKLYTEIIMTRETVSMGQDIGFLPGTEEEKMAPWMGALRDNLELLGSRLGQTEDEQGATKNILMNRIKIRSLNFMRGRTLLNRFMIIDEAQNLTAKQMKTLITRAGPGTKVVGIGNNAQIDTPYLTATTNGLTYTIQRFKPWDHAAHLHLLRGERSRLADAANDLM